MDEKARSLGKGLAPEAARRLVEIVGNDLRRLDNELEKLAVFSDEGKVISARSVDEATAWVRTFDPYELDNALEEGDLRKCILVLDGLLTAGEKPEQVLSRLVGVRPERPGGEGPARGKEPRQEGDLQGVLPADPGVLRRASTSTSSRRSFPSWTACQWPRSADSWRR